jgi:hypothetical protein
MDVKVLGILRKPYKQGNCRLAGPLSGRVYFI